MSLIAIVYKALLFSTAFLFIMLAGSYLAFILRKEAKKRKFAADRNGLNKTTEYHDPRKAVEEIKKIHSQSINAAHNYSSVHPRQYAFPRQAERKTRYDIINNTPKKAAKEMAKENRTAGFADEHYFAAKTLTLDFYKNS